MILLLTLAWQSFAIETHIHPPVAGYGAAASQAISRSKAAAASGAGGDQATCPICQQLTQVGHLLSPPAVTFDMMTAVALHASALLCALWSRRDRSHAWLGRGPPHRSLT